MERRRSDRFAPDTEIYARIKSSIPVRIVDVSDYGMKVESTSALPPSGECDIWLPTNDGDVKLRIKVQRCRARFMNTDDGFRGLMYHAGLEFVDVDEAAKFALVSIIQKLDTESTGDQPVRVEVDAGPEKSVAASVDEPVDEKGHEIVSKAV